MTEQIKSLAEALQDEIQRVMKIKEIYDSLPDGVGKFGSALMSVELNKAIKALAEGDVIQCMKSYETLKEYEN